MSEDKYSDGIRKTRSILGDVTNRVGKRSFSLVSGNSGVKSGDGDGYCENVDNKESQFSKQVCPGVENSEKKKCVTKPVLLPCSEIIPVVLKMPIATKDSNSSDSGFHLCKGNASRESVSVPASPCRTDCLDARGEHHKDEGASSEVAQGNSLHEHLVPSVCTNDDNDLSVDNLDSNKCGSIECSRLIESQESGFSGLEGCIGLKGDGCSNSSMSFDLIKSCSCSFCAKAAYIWSDLHYQDIKGRIAALKKSQKEASILVQSTCRNTGIEKHDQGNSSKFSKLESDLTGQWRSLFLHMEDILGRENSHLESSLFTLKDLRDDCKTELELVNGMPSEKQ